MIGPEPETPSAAPPLPGAVFVPWAPLGSQPLLRALPPRLAAAATWRLKVRAWSQAIARQRPDAVLASAPEALLAAAEARRRGAAVVYDAHEFYEDEHGDSARTAWVRRAHARAAHLVDGFVTVNAGIAALYADAQPGFPAAVVVGNGTPFGLSRGDGSLQAAAGLAPRTKVVLYHGSLAPMRGLDRLAAAAPLLPDGFAVVMMGRGPLGSSLAERVGPKLRLIPPVPYEDLPVRLAAASVGAVLYEGEALNQTWCSPNKFFEFASAGVPMIVGDLPGLRLYPDIFRDCVVVEAGADAARIAQACVSAVERRAVARANAREFAARHGWPVQAKAMIEAVENAIQRRSLEGQVEPEAPRS